MKKILAVICLNYLLFSLSAYSQEAKVLQISQSDSHISWMEINSENFKIVFPEYLQERANYTLNLLEYYRPIVAKSYDYSPKKLTLVIRPEMSLPNGFVSYAPRRSEWFNSSAITPLVGSLEWFQSLAVHEYRHVVQLDYISQGKTRWGYYLFGENILMILNSIVMPNWYYEGDAVWAETVYSDAGRGRSPRWSGRLKALITSMQDFSYDDLIAGDYTNRLPNHYIFGYFLATRMYNVYGKDIMKEIAAYASERPLNPYAFYNGFQYVTGKDFDVFFTETIQDLKKRWGRPTKEFHIRHTQVYYDKTYPLVDEMENKYYLHKSLDSQWALYKDEQKLTELNILPELSQVDFKNDIFVHAQNILDNRYLYKGYSDLFLYHTKLGSYQRISWKKRYFHPEFSPDGKRIVAIEMDNNDKYHASVLDLKGKLIKQIKLGHDEVIAEATWVDHNTLGIIKLDYQGKKIISQINLKTNKVTDLTPATRNNLYNLRYAQKRFYFEADYKGTTQIFSYHPKSMTTKQCTTEFIAAYTPYIFEDTLYYSNESRNGKRLKLLELDQCQRVVKNLFAMNTYLGKTASDFYHQTNPVEIKNYKKFYTKKADAPSAHNELTGLFSPHSWSFIGARGWQLQGTSNTMLGAWGLNAYIGSSAEENRPFTGFNLSYAKYYPILSFTADYVKRNLEIISGLNSEWTELKTNLDMTLPYIFTHNLYTSINSLTLGVGRIAVSENDYTDPEHLNDDEINTKKINISTSYEKNMTYRQIQPSYAASMNLSYTDIAPKNSDVTNYYGQLGLNFNLPGFLHNHGWNLTLRREWRPKNRNLYQLQGNYIPTFGYTFSRGYNYEFTADFNKASLEYILPLAYPKGGYKDWIYFTRIYAKVWSDHTNKRNEFGDYHALNSQGVDFIFNSNTFRKLPLAYGIRLINKLKEGEQESQAEVFINANTTF